MVVSGRQIIPVPRRVFVPMSTLAVGDRCPACVRSRLYPFAPLVRLRFTGLPLVSVTRYELERLRCGVCGALFVAHMPFEVGRETYDVSLKVISGRCSLSSGVALQTHRVLPASGGDAVARRHPMGAGRAGCR